MTHVIGATTFNGNPSIETDYAEGPTPNNPIYTQKYYQSHTSASISTYGFESEFWNGSQPYGDTIHTYNPAYQLPLTVQIGGQSTQAYDEVITGSSNSTSHESEQLTFVGVEAVTVPAGTFTACKIQFSYIYDTTNPNSQPQVIYRWYIKDGRYKGLQVKWIVGSTLSEATNLLINGS